jgi:hypothetical protein
MTQSTESPQELTPKTRWNIGFGLTMLIIGILACLGVGVYGLAQDMKQVKSLLINLRDKPIDTSGITHAEMQDLRHKVNAIERFIRTTPLVECGNDVKRREETSVRGIDQQR